MPLCRQIGKNRDEDILLESTFKGDHKTFQLTTRISEFMFTEQKKVMKIIFYFD